MAANSVQNFYQFSSSSKTVMDIEDSIVELKRCFLAEKIPINDDNSALHQFEHKLEMVLQCGLKEKPGVFGVKKSYWDYILACFSSSKRQHEGLKLVKSNSELKTSLGRGRALIRYCLMQKCLADTLQICFNDLRTTRDFYSEQYLPLQPKCWLSFFTSLYELNEMHFDLNPYHSELDVSWPSFARKLFTFPENQIKSSNNLSSSNITSSSPQETQELMDANSELEANVLYLQKRCDTLEKEICTAHNETKDQLVESAERTEYASENKDNYFKVMNNNSHNEANSGCDSKDSTKDIDLALGLNTEQDEGHCICNSTEHCYCSEHDKNRPFIECDKHSLTKTGLGNSHINKNESLFLSELLNVPTTVMTLKNKNVEIDLDVGEHLIANRIFNIDSNEIDCTNTFLPESLIVLVSELNKLIDNLKSSIDQQAVDPLVFSHVTQLRNIRGALDNAVSLELEKMQELRIKNQNFQNYAYCIKSLAVKQEILINNLVDKINCSMKEHKNLYDKICFLKNKLHSYGLLKTQTDSNPDLEGCSLPVDTYETYNGDIYVGNTNCDIETCGNVLNDSLESVNVLKKSCSRLHTLNVQATNLQLWIDSSHQLNNNLISRVQDQELHMKGITKQLEEAHQLLSVMRKQHKKLQSAENVVKYDLQEKRKLLNRLKQQLEATREDCNLVRLKNSESEVEWKSLRKEFVQRHKQNSEESGFIDDKGMEDQTVEPADIVCQYNSSDSITNSEICFTNCSIDIKREMKMSRLQMLEEQCQELCSNLINSSKKRKEIDCRLESWCKVIENSHKVPEELDNVTVICEIGDVCESVVEGSDNIVTEIDFNSDVDSSLSSSEMESLNSDSCSNTFNSTTIATNVSPLESETTNQSFSSDLNNFICNESNALHVGCIIENSTLSSKGNCKISSEHLEKKEDGLITGSVKSPEETSDFQIKDSTISEIDMQEKKSNEVKHEIICSAVCKSLLIEPENNISQQVSQLKEEKKIIMAQYGELQKENEMILKQLTYKTQQLQLTESTKDQEISALQFQLNSEALKYERALKEFSKNNDNLNDMKQKVNDQEELILSLEEALTEIQVEQESEREHQWEQLEDFRKYNLRDREAMEVEIIHLKNDLKMFQGKVIKLLKEKDLMWKKNDYLIHLHKIQIDDRWLDDHEVSECLGCKRQFSFILRKHHCRQCGRIFCNSCSNNWLMTPSSRKQIRVCNECYEEHIKIKKDVRRDSNELYFDGTDEADDDLSYYLNTSINSESRLNINDSFVSLPVMKVSDLKKGTHYTSAPELYSPLENHEKVNRRSADDTISITPIELAQNGTSGELLIKANEEAVLTIFNQHLTLLRWNFTLSSEAIPISLIYENEYHSNSQKNVIHQSSCETEGVVCLPLPGLYKFHFDNRLRLCPISVMYSYQVQIKNEQRT